MAWPFVGRDDEVARVRATLDAGGGVALVGPAGVGKSRLASEAVADRPHLRVLGEEGLTAGPLDPFRPLLPPGPAPSTDEVVTNLRQSLVDVTDGGRDAMLLVDDAHLLDPTAVAVVARLRRVGTPVLLTARTPDSGADVARLWQRDQVSRVVVGALDRARCDLLVRTVLEGRVGQLVLDELWRLSHGNVLHLHELVADALERGTVRRDRGRWTVDPPLSPSSRLAELVRTRLQRPSAEVREALELVAYAQPVALTTLERLVGPEALAEVDAAGLLEVTGGATANPLVRLPHPLYAEVLRAGLTPLRRRSLARRVAQAEPARHLDGEQLLRRAHLHLDAGLVDADLFVAAGRLAYGLRDDATALRLGRAAAEAGATYDGWILVAVAATELDDHALALEAYDRAGRAAPSASERTWSEIGRAYLLALRRGDHAAGREVLAAVAEGPPGPVHDDVEAWSALLGSLADPTTEAATDAHAVLVRAGDQPRAATVAGVALARAAAATLDGERHARAVAAVRRWSEDLAALRALPGAVELVGVLDVRNVALHQGLAPAARLAATNAEGASSRGVPAAVALATWGLGWIDLQHGRVDRAVERLLDARDLLERHAPHLAAVDAALDLGHGLLLAGRRSEVRALLETLDRSAAGRADVAARSQVLRLLVAHDDGEVGLEPVEDLAEELAGEGQHAAALEAWSGALHRGGGRSVPRGLVVTSSTRPAWLLRCARHATALGAGDLVALERTVTQHREDGRLLSAAVVALQAAELAGQRGEGATADRLTAHARVLADRCPGALLRASLPGGPAGLTRREEQVARLVAGGATNRETAELLGLSPRTVETHLTSVYGKLGLTGRRDLAALLAPLRADDRSDRPGTVA